jgi:hypothetical protein
LGDLLVGVPYLFPCFEQRERPSEETMNKLVRKPNKKGHLPVTFAACQVLRGQDLNLRPLGYELRDAG